MQTPQLHPLFTPPKKKRPRVCAALLLMHLGMDLLTLDTVRYKAWTPTQVSSVLV